jgi:hypothetical protein
MENSIQTIVSSIDTLTSLDIKKDRARLQELVDLYFNHPEAGEYLNAWFLLYERCPDDDSCDIFWSILHGIENYPNCDRLVVASVLRQPSEFPVMMVNRLLNGGVKKVGEVNLLELLDRVIMNEYLSPLIRENARQFLDYQKNTTDPT